MITGIPEVDNTFKDISESLLTSERAKAKEKFRKKLMLELKNATRSEKEFILFKTYFNGLHNDEISAIEILKKYPSLTNKLPWLIEEANGALECSTLAKYYRGEYCVKIMERYKLLLEKMTILSKELNINNSLELSILFSYLLWSGYLSKTKKHEYKEYDGPLLMGMNFTDITMGLGVCRNYSEMLKDFLNHNGYKSVILANYLSDNIKIDYIMNIKDRKVYKAPDDRLFKKKKANHAFNLIEDNGMYIYDSTNLLLYNLKNKNTAELVNGKGKNKIYPYRSYDFCYSKADEYLLDKMFTENKFTSPYDKTDFISTSEVTLDLIKSSLSLIEDFYKEAKPDILDISEETKKVLVRIR